MKILYWMYGVLEKLNFKTTNVEAQFIVAQMME